MKKLYLFIGLFCCLLSESYAQFAPQAGLSGSTAISATSGQFVGWATTCTVKRGLMNIADSTLGYASAGDSSQAIGPADDITVSLGDSGIADLTFGNPIFNGQGADFAVFENGFRNDTDSSEAFLELAYVEVSSDGMNYFRFPCNSYTQAQVQVGNGDYLDATKINNLAGKYVAMYGTPFDLEELTGTKGLDINNVTHVRIIDVVGSISGHSSRDSAGRTINDPYPTPYPSCGFDLDAIGAIYQTGKAGVAPVANNITVKAYPNPMTDRLVVAINGNLPDGLSCSLTDLTGRCLLTTELTKNINDLLIGEMPAGIYFLNIRDANGEKWVEKLTRR